MNEEDEFKLDCLKFNHYLVKFLNSLTVDEKVMIVVMSNIITSTIADAENPEKTFREYMSIFAQSFSATLEGKQESQQGES